MRDAVAVLSGGLDSTVALALALEEGTRVRFGLFFDYGQKAALRERDSSRRISRFFGVRWREIGLPWLGRITHTALVSRNRVPKPAETDLDSIRAKKTARAVWVPNRNGIFLNVAAAHAESIGAAQVITGFDREEARTFPDNSEAFLRSANRSFRYSTGNGVRARSPVARFDKTRIVREGIRLQIPFAYLWSCYLAGRLPCGRCESCVRSARAFRKNDRMSLWRGKRP